MQISGNFDVKLDPVEGDASDKNIANSGRMIIDKQFGGELATASQGEMLKAKTSTGGCSGSVAIEQIGASLAGKQASFVMQHFGVMTKGENRLVLELVTDSGTDELAGLTGKMQISSEQGQHFCDFDCKLASIELIGKYL